MAQGVSEPRHSIKFERPTGNYVRCTPCKKSIDKGVQMVITCINGHKQKLTFCRQCFKQVRAGVLEFDEI